MTSPAAELLILGVGSPYGQDDIAWWAVDFLQQHQRQWIEGDTQIEFKKLDRPGMALMQEWHAGQDVLIIDALVGEGVQSGQLYPIERDWAHPGLTSPQSSHELGVAQALAMAGVLGLLPGRLRVLGMGISLQGEVCEQKLWQGALLDYARQIPATATEAMDVPSP